MCVIVIIAVFKYFSVSQDVLSYKPPPHVQCFSIFDCFMITFPK